MQAKSKVLNLAMSLMIGGSLLAACSPKVTTPTGTTPGSSTGTPVTTPVSSNPGTTPVSSTPSSSSPASSGVSNSTQVTSEMQAVAADDATLADSQKTESSFATQALGIPARGEVSALGDLRAGTGTAAALRTRAAVQANTKLRLEQARKAAKDMAMKRKAALQASGAVKVNADGTITVDPVKLKEFVKGNVETRRAKLKEVTTKFRAQLQNFKAAATAQIQTLRRKQYVTRNSDVVETTNADGSKTKTLTVDFKNERTGVTRNVTVSRTFKDGKLVSSDFELKVTGPKGYERNVSRIVTVNADGSKSWQTTANTTWADGTKSERNETRSVDADGSATGSGTLTVTRKDGTTKTYNYTVGVTAGTSGASGDETVECKSDSASPDPAATPTPAATATPTPAATATPAASPTPEATASPDATVLSVTVEDTATSTSDTVVVEEQGSPATEESVDESADADAGVEATPAV